MTADRGQSDTPCYYPVFLDLRGKRCVVVGGGAVARRKVEGLVEAGCAVTVIAPHIEPMPDGVEILARAFRPSDLDGADLVMACTDDRGVNAEVSREAQASRIWANVADEPAACSFILPAVVRRDLESVFGLEYGELADLLWRLRQEWESRAKAAGLNAEARKAAWERVLDLPLADWLRKGDARAARKAAESALSQP